MLNPGTPLYRSLQWLIFPVMFIGPLCWAFSIVDLHRWHHSRETWQSNNNYGNNLIVYDVLFGTRDLPKDEPITTIGLINPD